MITKSTNLPSYVIITRPAGSGRETLCSPDGLAVVFPSQADALQYLMAEGHTAEQIAAYNFEMTDFEDGE